MQEAFCRAWLSLPDEVTSFRGWLFRVLRNLPHRPPAAAGSTCRRTTRRNRRTPHPGERTAAPRDAAALYRALERLPAADRELLTLHCFARLSGAELADTLHMTPPRCARRLRRARTRLRQKMEEDGYEF